MLKLSERLSHLAALVSENVILADVGTDHGYLPIYLLQTGRIGKAYAMDIGEGPLLRAKEHVEACGLGEYITLRRSDGVTALAPGEADSILIAGMGGGVTLHILTEGEAVISAAKELILQPQSEIFKVREYLYQKGYRIDREDMVCEEGKYYPMMHVDCAGRRERGTAHSALERQLIYRYGEQLLKNKNKCLYQYLLHSIKTNETIAGRLAGLQETEAIRQRREQVAAELGYARAALMYWKDGCIGEV